MIECKPYKITYDIMNYDDMDYYWWQLEYPWKIVGNLPQPISIHLFMWYLCTILTPSINCSFLLIGGQVAHHFSKLILKKTIIIRMYVWRRRMYERGKIILNLSCLIELRDVGSKLTPKANFKFPPIWENFKCIFI